MTDVCVQARRVTNNQRNRIRGQRKQQGQQPSEMRDYANSPIQGSSTNPTQLQNPSPLSFPSQLSNPSFYWPLYRPSVPAPTAPINDPSNTAGSPFSFNLGSSANGASSPS
ncbi:unnamed protein product [Rodentolepis nana]|uniref:BZIP domain-containing protein n=1 Tax=Rodentolepis nana TaxID=102285 RepID=A0A0R3TMP1_RODNA|nr:unnamed protein product [Rodentolepis nana]